MWLVYLNPKLETFVINTCTDDIFTGLKWDFDECSVSKQIVQDVFAAVWFNT